MLRLMGDAEMKLLYKSIPALVAAVWLCAIAAPLAQAQSTTAADLYRSAGQSLPPATQPIDPLHLPLDPAAAALVKSAGDALDLFDVASAMPFGAWGLNPSDAFSASSIPPHLAELVDRVVLRARLRFSQGQLQPAIDDLMNVLRLARRLSITPSLARQRLQNDLTRQAAAGIAQLLPALSPAQAQAISARLGELPSPADPAEALSADAQAYLWYHRCLYEDADFANLVERRPAMTQALIGTLWKPADIDDLFDNPVSFDLVMLDAERAFDDLIAALQQNPQRRDAELATALGRVNNAHPLVRNAGTLALLAVQQSNTQKTLNDLLTTALKIAAEAPRPLTDDAIIKLADPYKVIPTPNGLELISPADAALKLRLGPSPTPTQPSTFPAANPNRVDEGR
jgi:hypothetical protein